MKDKWEKVVSNIENKKVKTKETREQMGEDDNEQQIYR